GLLNSDRNRRFDAGMRVVAGQLKVAVLELVDVPHGGVQFHLRQRARLTRKLQPGLVEMIRVEVQVSEGVDEYARLQLADLRNHHRQQGIGGDIERHAEEQVRAALIELAVQLAVLHEELKQRMAG